MLLVLTGCTASETPAPEPAPTEGQQIDAVVLADPDGEDRQVLTGSPAEQALAASRSLFGKSPVAVVLADDPHDGGEDPAIGAAAGAAVGLNVPLLLIDPRAPVSAPVLEELNRLGVGTVVGYGDATADWTGITVGRDLLAGPSTVEGFSSVLGLSVTEQPMESAAVVPAVGALDSDELELVTISGPGADGTSQPGNVGEAPSPTGGEAPSPTGDGDGGDATGLAAQATTDELPAITAPEVPAAALVLATAASAPAAIATARASGADVTVLAVGDPRSTPAAVAAARTHADAPIYGIGADFGTAAEFAAHAAVAVTGVELPGGGQTVFPGRRMVALYGHPSGPYLGALGEQGIDATMDRVKELAAQYQPFSDQPVVPTLDLITTVASAEPGPDGDYSSETALEDLRPWVDAAEEAGVYVVLDFQSGRTDFLSQVRLYEELLVRPSVGLALDPEWRLAPGQLPLQQIGTVDAGEINASSAWLADLTRERNLPQKLFMVHQFRLDMIGDRAALDTSRSELAVTLHADGHGTPGEKLETWAVLQASMPAGVWPSWKNFYDEDRPMLTPEQTYSLIAPTPWLVTYQ